MSVGAFMTVAYSGLFALRSTHDDYNRVYGWWITRYVSQGMEYPLIVFVWLFVCFFVHLTQWYEFLTLVLETFSNKLQPKETRRIITGFDSVWFCRFFKLVYSRTIVMSSSVTIFIYVHVRQVSFPPWSFISVTLESVTWHAWVRLYLYVRQHRTPHGGTHRNDGLNVIETLENVCSRDKSCYYCILSC